MPFKDLGHHPEHMGHVVDHEHPDAIETGDARSCWGWPASGAHPLYAPWWSGLERALTSAMSTSTSSSIALRGSARRRLTFTGSWGSLPAHRRRTPIALSVSG